jgi:hypothetical protein
MKSCNRSVSIRRCDDSELERRNRRYTPIQRETICTPIMTPSKNATIAVLPKLSLLLKAGYLIHDSKLRIDCIRCRKMRTWCRKAKCIILQTRQFLVPDTTTEIQCHCMSHSYLSIPRFLVNLCE